MLTTRRVAATMVSGSLETGPIRVELPSGTRIRRASLDAARSDLLRISLRHARSGRRSDLARLRLWSSAVTLEVRYRGSWCRVCAPLAAWKLAGLIF